MCLKCLLLGVLAVIRIIFSAVNALWAKSSPTNMESVLRQPWKMGLLINSLHGAPKIAIPVFLFCF